MNTNLKNALFIVLLSGSASMMADFLSADTSNEAKARVTHAVVLETDFTWTGMESAINAALNATKSMKISELKQKQGDFTNTINQLKATAQPLMETLKQAHQRNNIDEFLSIGRSLIENNRKAYDALINKAIVDAQIQRLEANPS